MHGTLATATSFRLDNYLISVKACLVISPKIALPSRQCGHLLTNKLRPVAPMRMAKFSRVADKIAIHMLYTSLSLLRFPIVFYVSHLPISPLPRTTFRKLMAVLSKLPLQPQRKASSFCFLKKKGKFLLRPRESNATLFTMK